MKKVVGWILLIFALMMPLNTALADVDMENWTLTGIPYVDAHLQYTYMPTFEQMAADSIAEDLLDTIHPIIGVMMDGYNLLDLNFDDAYTALMVDLILNEETLNQTYSLTYEAYLEDSDKILSCIEQAAEQTLTSTDTLDLVLVRIDEMKKLKETKGLTGAESIYLESLLDLLGKAEKETFIKYICDDLQKLGKWTSTLNIALEATRQLTDILNLSRAYSAYQNMSSTYQAVIQENMTAARLVGEKELADTLERFSENIGKDFSVSHFNKALRDSADNIMNAVLSVFLDDLIGICAGAAQATGWTIPFITVSTARGNFAAGVGTVIGGVYLGVELGTLACDTLFNAQDITAGYKLLKAAAVFEQVNGQTLRNTADALRENPTEENAQKLHGAFRLQKSALLYAYDVFESWMRAFDEQVISLVNRDYAAAIEDIHSVKDMIQGCDCCKYIEIARAMQEFDENRTTPNSATNTPKPKASDEISLEHTAQVASPDLYSEIREIPRNNMDAVLMLDTSGSMAQVSAHTGKAILSYAQEAATVFVDQAFANNENYRVGLATFNGSAEVQQTMVNKENIQILRNSIMHMSAGGQTNIVAAFEQASQILEAEGRADARQIIVLFTDGIHNCSGDPVSSGEHAMIGRNGEARNIYTVGLVGALSEEEKKQVRSILDRPYAVRYIEIDEQEQIEGAFYLLGLAASNGDPSRRIHTLRVRGAKSVQVRSDETGEVLTSAQTAEASFGSVYMTENDYEAIYTLDEGQYSLQVCGGDVKTIGIVMETMDGRAVTITQGANLRFNGNRGTRLSADLSFENGSFELHDHSFDPHTFKGLDPFTGEPCEPLYEYKVSAGIANLPNGGLVSQRVGGYSASVPNEANKPDRVNEQSLEVFNPFFESEGFIVESRTSYNTNYNHYTYYLGGNDSKLYRVPEAGGKKEKVVDKKIVAYWVDETGIYYSDGKKIKRLIHGERKATDLVNHGVADGGGLSRMIRFGDYLYYIDKSERCIWAVPYIGGEPQKLTEEAARCLTLAQLGNDVVLIYNTYDKGKISEYLRVIYLDGESVHALEALETINTHYFNFANGFLYYCKKDENCALYRINLNDPIQDEKIANIHASRIFLFDDYVVTTDNSQHFCVMRPDGSEFRTIYAPYLQDVW